MGRALPAHRPQARGPHVRGGDPGEQPVGARGGGPFGAESLPGAPPVRLVSHESTTGEDGSRVVAHLVVDGEHRTVRGTGNGPIAAFVAALRADLGTEIDVVDYSEHAVGAGSDATAVAYVETQRPDGTVRWGVGRHESITTASFRAVVSALNRHWHRQLRPDLGSDYAT